MATIGFYYYSSLRTAEQLRLEGILTPLTFAPLTIKRIKRLTDETLQFTFAIPPSQLPPSDSTSLPLPSMPIKSVYLLQPELAIQRPYTPLSALSFLSAEEGGTGELDLVIKRYPDGEVSRWMHRLRVGDQVKMRGPTVTWTFDESKYDEIVFVRVASFLRADESADKAQIVGGTGVTPAYQMIEHVLASNTATPQKLTIIYASPSPSTILIKPELDSLLQRASTKGGPALEIKYLVSKDGDGQTGSPSGWFGSSTAGDKEIVDRLRKEGIELGRLGRKNLASWIGENSIDASTVAASRKVILVCGPEGYVPLPAVRSQG